MRKNPFARLLLAYFISQIGSHFLTLALASWVLLRTGSLVRASLVFVFSYLPPILVSARLGGWLDRRASRRLFITNELVSSGLSLLCGYCILASLSVAWLCTALAVRSIFGFTSRTLAMKWVKSVSPAELQGDRFKLVSFAFFLATAVSGSFAALVLGFGSIGYVVGIDVLTYFISAAILTTLSEIPLATLASPTSASTTLFKTFDELADNAPLCRLFLTVVFSQALFQGAYTVLVTALPMTSLGMGISGVGAFQLAASFGIISGFLILWRFPKFLSRDDRAGSFLRWGVKGIAVLGLVVSCTGHSIVAALIGFFLLNFGYEIIWLHSSADFFRLCPGQHTARYQFALTATGAFLMSSFTLVYSCLVGELRMPLGVYATLGLGFVIWVVTVSSLSRHEESPTDLRVTP